MAVSSAACWISILVFGTTYLVVPFTIWWIRLFIRANGWSVRTKNPVFQKAEEWEWERDEEYDNLVFASSFSNQ